MSVDLLVALLALVVIATAWPHNPNDLREETSMIGKLFILVIIAAVFAAFFLPLIASL